MSDQLILRSLSNGDEASFLEAREKWVNDGVEFSSAYDPKMDWYEYLSLLHERNFAKDLLEGRVADTNLYGFLGKKIVGRVSIRHTLNSFLKNYGGHIGYGILPEYRRRGFATEMLRQSLSFCRGLGIKKALVTCDDDNIGSIKTIERNGGVLETTYKNEQFNVFTRKYWIEIKGEI
ncbi:MAG: GNAT family N-acetyltransferase [Bacteriovoracaceae bacterium]|jgi:predicted acetyltransferase|nr:GNAT family N-acetyltransferase [Bacteriovoracaceae bacterium]